MLPTNRLKSKLKDGKVALGTWSALSSPNVVSVIGTTGLDFVIIDLEHSSTSLEIAENMLKSAQTTQCTPIIRTADNVESNILRSLEIGCQAIMIPHVEDPETANRVVQACKYYPEGNRGMGPATRHHDYCHENLQNSLIHTNRETFVGILIESNDGISLIDDIAKTPNLDVIYLGIYDISQSVGVPGQLSHPKVADGLQKSADIIRGRGLIAGSYAPSVKYYELLLNAGFQFIAYQNDAFAIRLFFNDFLLKTEKNNK